MCLLRSCALGNKPGDKENIYLTFIFSTFSLLSSSFWISVAPPPSCSSRLGLFWSNIISIWNSLRWRGIINYIEFKIQTLTPIYITWKMWNWKIMTRQILQIKDKLRWLLVLFDISKQLQEWKKSSIYPLTDDSSSLGPLNKDFSTHSYTSPHKIPTLLYTWGLKKVLLLLPPLTPTPFFIIP